MAVAHRAAECLTRDESNDVARIPESLRLFECLPERPDDCLIAAAVESKIDDDPLRIELITLRYHELNELRHWQVLRFPASVIRDIEGLVLGDKVTLVIPALLAVCDRPGLLKLVHKADPLDGGLLVDRAQCVGACLMVLRELDHNLFRMVILNHAHRTERREQRRIPRARAHPLRFVLEREKHGDPIENLVDRDPTDCEHLGPDVVFIFLRREGDKDAVLHHHEPNGQAAHPLADFTKPDGGMRITPERNKARDLDRHHLIVDRSDPVEQLVHRGFKVLDAPLGIEVRVPREQPFRECVQIGFPLVIAQGLARK